MWKRLQQNAEWGDSKTPMLPLIWKIQNRLQEKSYAFSEVGHLCRYWSCKKRKNVSHSTTKAEIISFDAGLRLKGIPATDSRVN